MQYKISVKRPVLGQKIYVPKGEGHVGGLGTIGLVIGDTVRIQEVPNVRFDWKDLVKDQIELVRLYGGLRAMPVQKRRVA